MIGQRIEERLRSNPSKQRPQTQLQTPLILEYFGYRPFVGLPSTNSFLFMIVEAKKLMFQSCKLI